jgi:hypothetical protein
MKLIWYINIPCIPYHIWRGWRWYLKFDKVGNNLKRNYNIVNYSLSMCNTPCNNRVCEKKKNFNTIFAVAALKMKKKTPLDGWYWFRKCENKFDRFRIMILKRLINSRHINIEKWVLYPKIYFLSQKFLTFSSLLS